MLNHAFAIIIDSRAIAKWIRFSIPLRLSRMAWPIELFSEAIMRQYSCLACDEARHFLLIPHWFIVACTTTYTANGIHVCVRVAQRSIEYIRTAAEWHQTMNFSILTSRQHPKWDSEQKRCGEECRASAGKEAKGQRQVDHSRETLWCNDTACHYSIALIQSAVVCGPQFVSLLHIGWNKSFLNCKQI